MKTILKSTATPLEALRLEKLADKKRAAYAIELAMKEFESDGQVDILLDTLRLVTKAQGGLTELARKTSLSRQALHEALSVKGNPRLRTFQTVLESLGFRISIKRAVRRKAS